jgi:UTP:GlnB (protein PII) uridylyltransferase
MRRAPSSVPTRCAAPAVGPRFERYSDRVDALLRQIFADAGERRRAVLVLALGGYGRRHLCFYSDSIG